MKNGPNVHFIDPETGEEYIGIPEYPWVFDAMMLWMIASLSTPLMCLTLMIGRA